MTYFRVNSTFQSYPQPVFSGPINQIPATILMDSGANINLMSFETMKSFNLDHLLQRDTSHSIALANGVSQFSIGYVYAPFQMHSSDPLNTVQIWIVSTDTLKDGKIIFGTPFLEICDSLSLKPL